MIFIPDANAALSNFLSGDVQLGADTVLRLEQVATLKREWAPRQLGTILQHPNQWRAAFFQFRPDALSPRALQDVRIRKALAHAIDRQPINEALYDGDAIFGHSMIAPSSEYAPEVERTVVRYPYDLTRSDQLMAEAGYAKVGGFYTSPSDGRLAVEARTNAAADNESELSILAAGWRSAGFDVQEAVMPAAQAQDSQMRSTFPGMYVFNTNLGDAALVGESSAAMPRPENRWTGANYGGYSNPEYDRLAVLFSSTVDRHERAQHVAEMVRIFTEDVGAATLFMRTQPWAAVSELKGMVVAAPEADMTWNIHEWTFR
jgi:peptide/nickel transport system substrate-binding protein